VVVENIVASKSKHHGRRKEECFGDVETKE